MRFKALSSVLSKHALPSVAFSDQSPCSLCSVVSSIVPKKTNTMLRITKLRSMLSPQTQTSSPLRPRGLYLGKIHKATVVPECYVAHSFNTLITNASFALPKEEKKEQSAFLLTECLAFQCCVKFKICSIYFFLPYTHCFVAFPLSEADV